jgi:hypothetical protein
MTRTLALALVLVRAASAWGHAFLPAVLDLRERDAGVFDVTWKPPADAPDGLAPRLPAQCRPLGARPSFTAEAPTHWRVDCRPAGLRGALLAADGLEGGHVDVVARVTWTDGTATGGLIARGTTGLTVPARPGPGAGAPAASVAARYARLGVEHILGGTPHLLFVHLLFVLALLLLVGRWQGVVRAVTAFTAAHSLTLGLAVLGFVSLPPAPVEVLIAASIVVLALELVRGPDAPPTLASRRPWAVAFLFGLLHGLGFAGALNDFGLPPDQIPLALLSFNGGVELGQLAFILVVVGPVALLARRPRLRLVPAYAIGGLATAWLLERLQQL